MEHLGQFIMHHWTLWLALVFVLLLIFINELLTKKKQAKALSPQSAIAMINNDKAIVIDLRDKEAYKNGHIIDSVNASVEDFDQIKMNKYKNKTLILACARGISAQTAATKLQNQGYQALVLAGGITAWQAADLPLIKRKG